MARKKEFDTERALKNAMHLFWRRGYERTSLTELLHTMQIGRASFYNAYGSKHKLFIQVLERYLKLANDEFVIPTLRQSESPLAGIHEVFRKEAQYLAEDADCKGCLMVNSEVEVMMTDAAARARITASMEKVAQAFHDALARAEAAGEIEAGQDLHALTQHLLNSLRGLKVLGRYSSDRAQFDAIVDVTMAALNPVATVTAG